MGIALKHNNNDDRDGEDDGPDALDAALVVVEEEFAAAPLADPALDGYDLHEIVSESDCKDRDCGNVQHRVELAYLSNNRDVLEVFVE